MCTLAAPAAAHAAGWVPAVVQPPAEWRADGPVFDRTFAAAPGGRAWAGWSENGDVRVSRREAGETFGAPERIGAGAELPLMTFAALGEHGPAAIWNGPGGLAFAEPGAGGRYAEIADPPFAGAGEQTVRLVRLAGGAVLAAWPQAGEVRTSVLQDGAFGPVTVHGGPAPKVVDLAVLPLGEGAVLVWSERSEETGDATLLARELAADGEWGAVVPLDEEAGDGAGRSARFDVLGLAARAGGGWTLLTVRFRPPDGGLGTPWRLEVRDGDAAAREVASGRNDGELGGAPAGGLETDGAGGTLLHWRTVGAGDDALQTEYRPAGGTWSEPRTRPAETEVRFVPLGGDLLAWLMLDPGQTRATGGGPARAGVLADDPPAGALRPRTFAADGAGHAFLQSDGALRVHDEGSPVLADVRVPGAGTAGRPLALSAAAADEWSAAGVEWDFGDGARAAGAEVSHAFAAAGRYTVRASAVDAAGNRTTEVRVVDVAAAGPPVAVGDERDLVAPVLGRVRMSGTRRGRRVTARVSLSEGAAVELRLQRARKGVRRAGRCRTSRAARRKGGRGCRRFVTVERVDLSAAAAGEIKRALGGRRLARGRYRVVVEARDAAGNVARRTGRVFRRR